jgi:hypothetical protein
MTEIVRMTTQQQPLEVGIPLYPFSHASVFAKGSGEGEGDEQLAHVAPLPFQDENDTGGSALSPNALGASGGVLGGSPVPGMISPMMRGASRVVPGIAGHGQGGQGQGVSPVLAQARSVEAAAAWAMTDLSRGTYK